MLTSGRGLGPAGDYNRWKELGNPGWGYEDLEPYFAKSESARSHPASQFRGKTGRIRRVFVCAYASLTPCPVVAQDLGKTGPSRTKSGIIPLSSYIRATAARIHGTHRALRCSVIRAAQNAGIPYAEDLSAPSTPAAAYVRHDISQDSSMRRHTPFHAFLSPKVVQARRQRLKICPHALVTRIEVAAPSGDSEIPAQAVGVHFEAADFRQAGKSFYAHARREVVLCAGALASPQILMLRCATFDPRGYTAAIDGRGLRSGIGPKAHLEEKGIWVRRDLPGVGSYLVSIPDSHLHNRRDG